MDQHSGGDAVVDVLEGAGVRVVFGIPSVHNLPIYDSLRRRGSIRAITVRHEQGAAGAADAYARVTGGIGVLITSTGPGAANAMGGLLEAQASGSPVLHITGQIETRFLDEGRGFIHEVPDQPAMLGAVSKAVHRAKTADDIAPVVAAAIAEALTHPQGPVSVELPIDLQYAPVEPLAPAQLADALTPQLGFVPDRAEIARAAEVISAARRPLLWAGGGAVAAAADEEVLALARRLGAGVLTSPNGRGVVPEDDPCCIGNLSWDRDVRRLCQEADLLVAVGTRYQGPNTENWKMQLPATIVQIDVDPDRPGKNYPATVTVRGDAEGALQGILVALDAGAGAEEGWRAKVVEAAGKGRSRLRHVIGAQEALLDELTAAIGPQTVVVKDATIAAYTWGNRLLPVARSRRAVMPNGFAIGLGITHAVGAGAAVAVGRGLEGPGRPDGVVLMAGDGGFMLAATELATLASEQLPVVVIVFCDGGYGILRNIQDKQYGLEEGRIGVDLGRPDFVALAAALGVPGVRVSSAEGLGAEVRNALASDGPALVEVDLEAIGPMSSPYTGTSRPPAGATRGD